MKTPQPKRSSSSLWEEAKEIESLIKLSSFLDKLPPNEMRDKLIEEVKVLVSPTVYPQETTLLPNLSITNEPETVHEINRLKDVIKAANTRIYDLESIDFDLDSRLRALTGTWWYKWFSSSYDL